MFTMMQIIAVAGAACLLMPLTSADGSLPSDWRTGIATNYGGAQDGKVSNTTDHQGVWYCLYAYALYPSDLALQVLWSNHHATLLSKATSR